MNAYRHEPLAPRGPVHVERRSKFWVLAVVLIAGVELAGMLAVPMIHGGGAPPVATSAAAPAPAVAPVPAATTHGDLVVTAGHTVYLPEKVVPPSPTLYYQGGNITVESGGTLIVQNTTLVFVQFVGTGGPGSEAYPINRLSHVFKFTIENAGTAIFRNSTLTTATSLINPYPKINVVDNGTLTFWNSKVESAGFLTVGTGGDLTLNQSSVSPNSGVANMTVANGTRADLAYAPTLLVNGGQANLFSSVYRGLYSDNLTLNGTPGPLPLNSTGTVGVTNATNTSSFTTPTGASALTDDYLYPNGIAGGVVTILYNNTIHPHISTTATVMVTYGGLGYPLGPVTIPENSTGSVSVPFTLALVTAINNAGLMTWLNRTGDFGLAAGIYVAFHVTAGPPVVNATLSVLLEAPISFGMSAVGGTSTLSTVDSYIGLNFSAAGDVPWQTHQLALTSGATAYLANLTVKGNVQNGTSQYSNGAVTTDSSSHAYLFRWARLNLTGRGGALPVPNATVSAPYAYNSSQADNLTAQRVNGNLTPAILGYLQYWDKVHGVAKYGESDPSGAASLLLASNDLYGGSAPDGDYLGNYHVVVTPPTGGGAVQAYNYSVRPYPVGVANGSAGYGTPDYWGFVSFPLYFAAVNLAATNAIVVTADNATATTITIGQWLNVTVNIVDNGPAPITSLLGTLYYNATGGTVLGTASKIVDLTAPGQAANVSMTWKVNETVVGLHGKAVADDLAAQLIWNHDLASRGGGFLTTDAAVNFAPSHVHLSKVLPVPPSSLSPTDKYNTSGVLAYNGTGVVVVDLIAWPANGGATVFLAEVIVENTTLAAKHLSQGGPINFTIAEWNASKLVPGDSYHLSVTARYNGVTANDTLPGTYATPGPSALHFFTEKFLGLAIWEWIVIAAAIAAGVVGFLLFSRRQAAGKLVECGECGNLVPEDSRVCPKCGAEFESDVVRCSRCSSTIPANSQFCPECAAQLLGKPGEGGTDPERQAYADFTERYRAEAKKELGENYGEGAFWDWWKRQPSYTPFSQWKVQQGQGTSRTGMSAPPPGSPPPAGPGAAAGVAAPPRRRTAAPPPARPPSASAAPAAGTPPGAAPGSTAPPMPAPAAPAAAMKPCPNCGKEIPPEYLVCPFCGSVTQ
ncbi:MAG TPA: zinc ribbon domain-containing protein [Thermoplasmata archaeon]|nr:zinc ribbon domain-containing protein [Thermoplasmata archaeon]